MRNAFLNSLKTCANKKDLYHGSRIHADIRASGLLEKDTYLGNALVSMYAKCGALFRAQQVADELPVRNVVSWTALISGYVQHGQGQEAVCCFRRMRSEGFSPDAVTYACILKACGIVQDADMGKGIHDDIASQGLLQKDVVLGGALVAMYVKCGLLLKAQKVFDTLPVRTSISWTGLIAGYIQHGLGEEALGCFRRMRDEGFTPDAVTYACVLKACGIMQDFLMGTQIHDDIVSQGLLKKDIVLGNALVDMYAQCGALLKAQEVFDSLSVRNAVSWNALIAGYIQKGHGHGALGCFQQMRSQGFSPNAITYACVLKACGIMQEIGTGSQIHDDIVSQGLLEKNVMLGGALVDMYVKCGVLLKAQEVFDTLPMRSAVSWTALIAGYVQHEQGQKALRCFHWMQIEGFSPDVVTYACILKACGIMQDVGMGKQIHNDITRQGLLKKDATLGGALIDMYAQCGLLLKAQEVFDTLPVRNGNSWNTLIAGYAQQGRGQDALQSFQQMRSQGFSPDALTYACILKACGMMEDADMGEQIHDEIVSQGLLRNNTVLGNALVDMYAKCSKLSKAQQVFDELPIRDVVSWTALMAGYAQQGKGEEALGCFHQMRSEGFSPNVVSWNVLIGGYTQHGLAKEALECFHWMQQEGISPNAITFVNVLNACSHCGLIDEGQTHFDNMREKYGIAPKEEHFTCMVDLFGREGLFDKAMRVVSLMPSSGYFPVWSALLGACQKWGNLKLGRFAFERAIKLDQRDAAPFVFMSNIYAAAGMQEEAENIQRMRLKNIA